MAFLKDLLDKALQKTAELEAEAKRRASKKAGDLALHTGKAAAKAAVKGATKTLDYMGKKIEDAIFGAGEPRPSDAANADDPAPPDPFAKVKADAARREAEQQSERVQKGTETRV